MILTQAEIIEIRKATQPTNFKPWADTLAFAEALMKAFEAKLRLEGRLNETSN